MYGGKEFRLLRAGQVWECDNGDILLVTWIEVTGGYWHEVAEVQLLNLMSGEVYNPMFEGRDTTGRLGWKRVR